MWWMVVVVLLLVLALLMVARRKKRIGVCCFCIGEEYKKSIELCLKSHKKYCEKHNYDYITDETIFDDTRHPSWSKIKLIQKYLPNYEYLLWIDADAMITNYDIVAESLLSDKFLLISSDWNGINAGVFIIRNDPMSFDFLDDVWNNYKGDVTDGWWEQNAIQYFAETEKYKPHIEVLDGEKRKLLNSYDKEHTIKHSWKPNQSYWTEGDFIIHFPGKVKEETDFTQLQIKYYHHDP
jgi:hypothetical protein